MLDFINNNDFNKLFEKRLSDYTSAKYVVLTDSCSNAIFLVLKYLTAHTSTIQHELSIPKQTYISVPQAIINAGYTVKFEDIKWQSQYKIGDLPLYDSAVGFEPEMYIPGTFQCLSFQQKKALKIGKGGCILLDDEKAYKILQRMSHDGRDSSIPVIKDKPIMGYHMNMIPADAASGTLLINQYKFSEHDIGESSDYPDISQYFK